MGGNKLNLVVDMNGCPNRCLHCWLGHMPNRKMEEGSDRFIVDFFSPYFDKIAFYSWLREPDHCDDYEERWKRDLEISRNTAPERFELASFHRIVRDEKYVPFLRSVGVKKVQLESFDDIAVCQAAKNFGLLDRLIILRVGVNMDVLPAGVTPEMLWGTGTDDHIASEESMESVDIFETAMRNCFAAGKVLVDAILEKTL